MWRARARTHVRRRPAGRHARARARRAPRQRLVHSAGWAAAAAAVGAEALRVRGPSRVCGSSSATLRFSHPSLGAGCGEGNGASVGNLEHTPGCFRHRHPSFPSRGPRSVLGDSAGRRRRPLPVCGEESCPAALLRSGALKGRKELGFGPSSLLFRQPVGAASVREVSGLRRRQLLRLHHVRGRRLRESAEEIQAGVPGGAER